ncbi:MAG: transposase [Candidatus Competibacteraceae bacterium]
MEVFPAEAHHVIPVLAQVVEHEAVTRDQAMTPSERLAYHQAHRGPVLETLHDWLEQQFQDRTVEPNSSLGKAFSYLLNRWPTLTQFLRVDGAPLDSNTVERARKRISRQRKNSLFYASSHRAQVASILTRLIATWVQAGVNALEYLVALQTHRHAGFQQPAAWLPWNYQDHLAPV